MKERDAASGIKGAASDIGYRLRRLVGAKGETLTDFAARVGIPYRTLQSHVSGTTKPNADQLAKLGNAGLDLNFLLTGKTQTITRRIANLDTDTEEAAYFATDSDIVSAVDRVAKEAVDSALQAAISRGERLEFAAALALYLSLYSELFRILVRIKPPIMEARKLGMSIDDLIASMLGPAAQTLEVKITKAHRDAISDPE